MFIFVTLLLIVLSPLSSCAEENITFTTTGSTFAPSINVTGSPTILWTFSDGSTSTSLEPSVSFGSTGERNQTLKVTPWSALTQINLGYGAQDGGDTYNGNTVILKTAQNVKAVYGLENVNSSLVKWASSGAGNTIPLLNFTDFTSLTTVEAFYCGSLHNIVLKNTPSIKRVCAESCGITTMDYSDVPNMQDIRLANQDDTLTSITWASGNITNWHICCHTNPTLTTDIPTERFVNVTELMIQGNNQTGELRVGSTRLDFIYANDNHFTSANLSGTFPNWSKTARLQNNNLTHIDLTGCKGLYILNCENNDFNQSEVDYIFITMKGYKDAYGYKLGQVRTVGNTAPSVTGLLAAIDLDNNGKTVSLDMPTDLVILNEKTTFRANGTTVNASTQTRTLDDIEAVLAAGSSSDFKDTENISIIPSSGKINVTVTQWGEVERTWSESSDVSTITTQHIFGGFPANTPIQITRDNTNYAQVTSNNTGFIDWTYSGGYSDHIFGTEAVLVPDADFTVGTTSGTAPLTVQFTDTSLNGPTSWAWVFGDGETSTEQSPSHTYTEAGTYDVSLTATNDAGSNALTSYNAVTVTAAPGTQTLVESSSFVSLWGSTVGMVSVIVLVVLLSAVVGTIRGKGHPIYLVNDIQGILIVAVLLFTGAIIFSQF
jgi:PKD repeat protein